MTWQHLSLSVLVCLVLLTWQSARALPADLQDELMQGASPRSTEQPGTTPAQRLIEQLGSPNFGEREAVAKTLRRIGEPVLGALREAARVNLDAEVRRRARQLVEAILDDRVDQMLKEATEAELEKKDYRKAAELLERMIELMKKRSHPNRRTKPPGNLPSLTDAHLRLARVRNQLHDYVGTAQAYREADYYCDRDDSPVLSARTLDSSALELQGQ